MRALRNILTNGGELRVGQPGHRHIVEADDGQVGRHAQAMVGGRRDDAHGGHVGRGEDAVGAVASSEIGSRDALAGFRRDMGVDQIDLAAHIIG